MMTSEFLKQLYKFIFLLIFKLNFQLSQNILMPK